MKRKLTDQEEQRRESLQQIRDLGIDPYPAESFEVNVHADEILNHFDESQPNYQEVQLAGRLMQRRVMGKASFAELQDESGTIQLYFSRDDICPGEDKTYYNKLFKKLLDIGDIIGVKGYTFRTKMGEITVFVREFRLLSKALRPLPVVKEKGDQTYDAFTDPEQRHRMRYIDLIVNTEVRERFKTRTRIMNAMRDYLNQEDYLEVETPVLQPLYGGAAARPFKTYHNTLEMPLYLRIANELYLKRLIVGGYEGVYEFAKDFRNEGMSRYHNPEFTQMEMYVAYKDYYWMMDFVEDFMETIVKNALGTTNIQCGDNRVEFKKPWKRYTMYEAIEAYTGYDLSDKDEAAIKEIARSLKVPIDDSMDRGKLIDEIFGEHVEPKLIDPTFIMDYPLEMSPLAKKHREKEGLVERFEVICMGKEIMNAFSELNDPIDQRERFEEQLKLGERGDEEAMLLDEDFLRALEIGMPPTTGLGVGIDRLTMILTNQASIQEILFFPQMRPEQSEEESGETSEEEASPE